MRVAISNCSGCGLSIRGLECYFPTTCPLCGKEVTDYILEPYKAQDIEIIEKIHNSDLIIETDK